jgi:hypothetical protein
MKERRPERIEDTLHICNGDGDDDGDSDGDSASDSDSDGDGGGEERRPKRIEDTLHICRGRVYNDFKIITQIMRCIAETKLSLT